MTSACISESLKKISARVLKSTSLVAVLLVAAWVSVTPAQAQSSDTWKSVAIIGGSTAAGAYIGHKVGGTTGAYVGAAAGAATGYAIDRRRRQNEYYNSDYSNGNGGYYGNSYPYSGNNGYNGDSGNYYPSGNQSDSNYDRPSSRRR